MPSPYRSTLAHSTGIRRCAALALLLPALTSCWRGDYYDEPEVRSVSPANGAVNVPVDVEIRVEFDRRIRASTLDGGNFYVWDLDADLEVPGTRSYEVDTRTAVFLSTDLYQPNRRYRIVVDDDVRSECCGARLRNTFLSEFTTGDASPSRLAGESHLRRLAVHLADAVPLEESASEPDVAFEHALGIARRLAGDPDVR